MGRAVKGRKPKRITTAPRADYDPRLENVAERQGLQVGDEVCLKDGKRPLGPIKRIDERGIHVAGGKNYHPDFVEPVTK